MHSKKLIALVLLSLSAFFAAANEVKNISQEQLLSLLNAPKSSPFLVLDVRSEEEFSAGHIQGAINISHDQIEQQLAKLSGFEDKMLVVHCRSGRRAQTAEAVLLAKGFNKVHHLTGDYKAWLAADLPLVKN